MGEGAYGARNKGASSARASRIAFCDADDVVADGWLEAVARGLDEFSLVTGPLDLRRLNSSDVVGWRTRTLWDRPLDWHAFLPVALNCNLAIRREVFDVIGGFRLVDSGSDFRFVWEAQLRGWKLGYSPGALVHRREPASWRAFLRRSFRDGRHEPQLYKDFRRSGMPRSSLTRAAMFWLLLALGAPALCVSRWRYAWSAAAGMRAGRLVGSVRSRVMYL
ncbi:MAG: glycosyltransferase [Acidimicrobiales bacterium]